VGVSNFSLGLLGYQSGILSNPCLPVLHGLANVGLTLPTPVPRGPAGAEKVRRWRVWYVTILASLFSPRFDDTSLDENGAEVCKCNEASSELTCIAISSNLLHKIDHWGI